MKNAIFALVPLAALTLSACMPDALTSVLGQALSHAASVNVSGTIYGPADQVAVIAAGGGNVIAAGGGNAQDGGAGTDAGSAGFQVLARSDETGAPNAKVVFTALGSIVPAGGAIAGNDGKYTAAVPGGATYAVTAIVSTKSGSIATLSGIEVLGTSDDTLDIDAAENLVAAKILSLKPKTVDGDKLKACVSTMESELSSQSRAPLPSDAGAAATMFDSLASSDLKSQVQAAITQ